MSTWTRYSVQCRVVADALRTASGVRDAAFVRDLLLERDTCLTLYNEEVFKDRTLPCSAQKMFLHNNGLSSGRWKQG